MAGLTLKHVYYDRYAPIMTYEMEVNGNVFQNGQLSTYNILEGVEEGLNRLLESLARAAVQSEAVTITGVVLNVGTKQYLTDKYTVQSEIASLTFA